MVVFLMSHPRWYLDFIDLSAVRDWLLALVILVLKLPSAGVRTILMLSSLGLLVCGTHFLVHAFFSTTIYKNVNTMLSSVSVNLGIFISILSQMFLELFVTDLPKWFYHLSQCEIIKKKIDSLVSLTSSYIEYFLPYCFSSTFRRMLKIPPLVSRHTEL